MAQWELSGSDARSRSPGSGSLARRRVKMVRGGFHLDVLHSACCSGASTLQFFIFGLILVYYTMPSSSGRCSFSSTFPQYKTCGFQPDGVHDLDCYRKRKPSVIVCVWKPGRLSPENTYTLIVQNRKQCIIYSGIANFSKEINTMNIFTKVNMTVEVFEHSKSANCTKAVFRGSPESLVRCGSPNEVTFSRRSGSLLVNVSWPREDVKTIGNFSVSYKAPGGRSWGEPVISQNPTTCRVDNLNASLVYSVRIRCVPSDGCPQCAESEAHTVPPELTTRPLVVDLQDTDVGGRPGSRLLSLSWKFPAKEPHDGYRVTAGKASGEAPQERITTSRPEIALILSYSAYRLAISAVNNASTSPAAIRAIPRREDGRGTGGGKLNVTVHSNASFTVHWKDDLVRDYVCYSVEWTKEGHGAAYRPFFQSKDNYKKLSPLPELLEPFKRYSVTLHTRPDRDTCNMKRVNNSESTYATTQFYSAQGPPVAAPANISSPRATADSMALQWSSIPEEEARGFLLGYRIHYGEQRPGRSGTERNVTVDPALNSFELRNLKSGTAYEVQMSGFTAAGEGVRSPASFFKTDEQESSHLSGIIAIFAVAASGLMFGPVIIRRAKGILWPSIPNPEKSNAMQNLDEPCERELLESITTLQVEEWDTASFRLEATQHLTPCSEGEGDSDWTHRDDEDSDGEFQHEVAGGAVPDVGGGAPPAPPGGYTTLDLFQRATETRPQTTGRMDYIRQFSTSLMVDSEAAET